MKYVHLDEGCVAGKYVMHFDFDKVPLHDIKGSTNVLAARLMGLDFISYCRMCRDVFGAELFSKVGYPIIYFQKNKETFKLLEILDKKIDLALTARKK